MKIAFIEPSRPSSLQCSMTAHRPRLATVLGVVLGAVVTLTAAQAPSILTFDHVPIGTLPEGFAVAALRQAKPGQWLVARIGGAVALHHPASADADGWSLALASGTAAANLRVTARVRLASGTRIGGVVWHYQDARNFMAALLDLDDGDLELFRVWDGNRIRLEDRDGLELDSLAWHSLKVIHDDGRTTVSIGGIRVLDRRERRSSGRTGRAGVLAHGRTDAAFDDLRIESTPGRQSR
jgi:hypothetical protein